MNEAHGQAHWETAQQIWVPQLVVLVEELGIQDVALGVSVQGNTESEGWGEEALSEQEQAADLEP